MAAGNLTLVCADLAAIPDRSNWAWAALDRAIQTWKTVSYYDPRYSMALAVSISSAPVIFIANSASGSMASMPSNRSAGAS